MILRFFILFFYSCFNGDVWYICGLFYEKNGVLKQGVGNI